MRGALENAFLSLSFLFAIISREPSEGIGELVDGWIGGEINEKRDQRMDYILARDLEYLIDIAKLDTLAKGSIPH